MKRVKDEFGNIVPGLLKDERGALVVSDVGEYHKYKRQKELIEIQSGRIDALNKQVENLQLLVERLLDSKQ
jgi:hypothetical protein